jgi:hypothetical protein
MMPSRKELGMRMGCEDNLSDRRRLRVVVREFLARYLAAESSG